MTNISAQREAARQPNGEFGEHTRSGPETGLLPDATELTRAEIDFPVEYARNFDATPAERRLLSQATSAKLEYNAAKREMRANAHTALGSVLSEFGAKSITVMSRPGLGDSATYHIAQVDGVEKADFDEFDTRVSDILKSVIDTPHQLDEIAGTTRIDGWRCWVIDRVEPDERLAVKS